MDKKLDIIKDEIERLKTWQPEATPSLDKLLELINSIEDETVPLTRANSTSHSREGRTVESDQKVSVSLKDDTEHSHQLKYLWHSGKERPTRLPILHIWYHESRGVVVACHEDTPLQEEINDINFQPDDKWAYIDDLLNIENISYSTDNISNSDLEKEMDSFFLKMQLQGHENIFETTFKDIAKHFAEWQKCQDDRLLQEDCKVYKEGKKSGMRYMRQILFKDAINAKVLPANLDETEFCLDDYDEVSNITARVKAGELKMGDKVKIVIVKAD